MKPESWKILAIVSIIAAVFLLFLLLIETAIFGIFLIVGMDLVQQEDQCAALCSQQGDFYSYDDDTEVCSCINDKGEIVSEAGASKITAIKQ